jgi:hypothetical protein
MAFPDRPSPFPLPSFWFRCTGPGVGGYAGHATADLQGAIDYLKSLPQVLPNFGCVAFAAVDM